MFSTRQSGASEIQAAAITNSHVFLFDRYVIDNKNTDFEGKLQRLVNLVAKLVGLPTNLSRRSAKYLLRQPVNLAAIPKDIEYHSFQVEKVGLSAAKTMFYDEWSSHLLSLFCLLN